MTLCDQLHRHADAAPGCTAVRCDGLAYTYGQLWADVCAAAGDLRLAPGALRPLRAMPAYAFLVDYLATHMAGGVAVPLAKDLPDAEWCHFVDACAAQTAPAGVADILHTTGATGKQKAVMVGHEAIMANADNLVLAQGYRPDLTFVVSGPLNHIGSLSKVQAAIYAGATVHLLAGMKDMAAFWQAVDEAPGRVATFLVPASLRMLMTFARDKMVAAAPKLEFIETGAAPMAQADMQTLCDILPATRLYNTYASTETGIIATYNYNGGDGCMAGCLGRPMRHSSFVVTADGLIACQGPTLMTGYWHDEEATRRVLHDGMLHTADLGRIDAEGRLHLLGRNDDVINIGGFKVAPSEVEDAALAFPLVRECVCTAAAHPVMGMVLKLIVVAADGYSSRDLARFLRAHLEPHKVPALYEQATAIRRTFNGKIDRKSYRQA